MPLADDACIWCDESTEGKSGLFYQDNLHEKSFVCKDCTKDSEFIDFMQNTGIAGLNK